MPLFNLLHVASIDSTNTHLLQLAAKQSCHMQAIVADEQTAGRGQRGRRWIAAPGAALLCSVAWQFERTTPLEGLSLAMGVMVAEALAEAVAGRLSLKWPNDLLIDETYKLGGILIETVPSPNRTRTAVIGLGLNLRSPDPAHMGSGALPATGLDASTASRNERDAVLERLLAVFGPGLEEFAENGFISFRERWWRLRAFANAEVIARLADGAHITGRMVELTDRGALVIESATGLHTLVSGEVSLRARA
jgi:BirA family transcriptional regulator, biotin operon repressor / biotin---[acetyl-CoA-carboxylase] ligase